MNPNVERRDVFARGTRRTVAARRSDVDLPLENCRCDHSHSTEAESEYNARNRRELDVEPTKKRIETVIDDGHTDDNGERVDVADEIVRSSVARIKENRLLSESSKRKRNSTTPHLVIAAPMFPSKLSRPPSANWKIGRKRKTWQAVKVRLSSSTLQH